MRIGFVTCDMYPNISESDQLCANILSDQGHFVEAASWNNSGANWGKFDFLIFRSCWDYYNNVSDFKSFVKNLNTLNLTVFNSVEMILWNHHKKYVQDLGKAGVAVPRTVILRQGHRSKDISDLLLAEGWPVNWEKLVMKPCTSASGMGVQLIKKDQLQKGNNDLNAALEKSDIMLQEYMHEVVSTGEQSFVFFNGVFSHTVLKKVDNTSYADEFRINSQYGGVNTLIEADPSLLEGAHHIIETIRTMFNEFPLYARIDGVKRDNCFVLMEAELIEPGLFFTLFQKGAKNFADAILERI